ncbi:MAG: DUF5678 domain-containing protein [Thermoproteota archaeon]|nr:DUF5678 domain-containing protein [Thermoproteota archaeon]
MPEDMQLLSQRSNLLLENKAWLNEQIDKLRGEYPDEYVAVNQGEIVGHNKDLAKLLKTLRSQFGKFIDHIAIDFVSKKKIELILHIN